ncbi:MAG: hypothetical protein MZU95_10285 [Desulfomicrobium escambiense]|nr:hypothetical protein [Desulfomicrobium escambiense]
MMPVANNQEFEPASSPDILSRYNLLRESGALESLEAMRGKTANSTASSPTPRLLYRCHPYP